MAAPTTPLRVKVIDRFVAVLGAMTDGTKFNYKAYEVGKRLKNFNECAGFPTYMVFISAMSGPPVAHLDNEYDEAMVVSVQCWVDMELGEPTTKMAKCLRDVQKAINDDSKSTDVGSLGQLSASLDVGTYETDNGGFSAQGVAFFEQQFVVHIVGDWGEL